MRGVWGLAVLLGLSAAAQAQEIQGGYVGVSAGYFQYQESAENLGLPIEDSTSSYRVFGGYQFNDYYAVEAGWQATGDIKEGFNFLDPTFGSISFNVRADYEIATLRVLAMAPLQTMSIFGALGYYDSTLSVSLRLQDAFDTFEASEQTSGDGVTVAGGMQWELDRVAIRAEYEWFDTDGNVDANNLGVSVLFRF
jgi:OOP family OmpA-OmpF porin